MTLFSPQGTLHLIGGVPLDNKYEHTITFDNVTEQFNYFNGKTKTLFNDYNFIRKDSSIKIAIEFEKLWDVNYISYLNYQGKRIYAFITDKRYINKGSTELIIETDVLQTYQFDYDIKSSYVEREHVDNDGIGEHTFDEGLNVGDYITRNNTNSKIDELDNISYIISSSVDINGNKVDGGLYNGVYSGLAFYGADESVVDTALNEFISSLDTLGKADAINSIFTIPSYFMGSRDENYKLNNSTFSPTLYHTVNKNYSDLDGYTPKNNKLFCYPYNFLFVTNYAGQYLNLKYEYSKESNMSFGLQCDINPNPNILLTPLNYSMQLNDPLNYNDEFTLSLNGYPLCNWNSDTYANWLAQNQISNIVGVGSSVLGLGVGLATANPIAIGGGVLGVSSSIGSFYEQSLHPPTTKGTATGSARLSKGILNFGFHQKTIRKEYAKIIDNYFTKYGYKINELKTPNIRSRRYWNYIKTHECNVLGDIDSDELTKIRDIYNQGVTFWHCRNGIVYPFDYSKNNYIV